jgi:hypothetical protein
MFIEKGLVKKPADAVFAPRINETDIYYDDEPEISCILPQLNPYEPSIISFINPQRLPGCTTQTEKVPTPMFPADRKQIPQFVELRDGTFHVTEASNQLCQNLSFRLLSFGSDEKKLRVENSKTVSNTPVTGDFVEVICKVRQESSWHGEVVAKLGAKSSLLREVKNFRAQIYENESIVKRVEKQISVKYKGASEQPLNVLFLGKSSSNVAEFAGFDSTSRAGFYRELPETVNYLSKRFSFVNDKDPKLSAMRRSWEARMKETGEMMPL